MNTLEVTKVKFFFKRPNQSEKVIANCSIELNGLMTIHNIRFMYDKESDRYFTMFPSQKTNGEFFHVVRVMQLLQNEITAVVREQYQFLKQEGLWRDN